MFYSETLPRVNLNQTEVNKTNLQKLKRISHTLSWKTENFEGKKNSNEYFLIYPHWKRIECLLKQLKWNYEIIVNPLNISLFLNWSSWWISWREIKTHCSKMNQIFKIRKIIHIYYRKKNFNWAKRKKITYNLWSKHRQDFGTYFPSLKKIHTQMSIIMSIPIYIFNV